LWEIYEKNKSAFLGVKFALYFAKEMKTNLQQRHRPL